MKDDVIVTSGSWMFLLLLLSEQQQGFGTDKIGELLPVYFPDNLLS